jgi:glycosyltransferase involved in cell wall biosynthesis
MDAVTPSSTDRDFGSQLADHSLAVLLPCHNEEAAIAKVVQAFRTAFPHAHIFVYDNCSTDSTSAAAEKAGAIVRREPWPGKGNVVRRMFADIDADIYLMADGDGTYDATAAPEMVSRLLIEHLDMVVGTRRDVYDNAHRKGHGFGNMVFNKIYRSLFGPMFTDIFSGYRVFSRRFVKSFPAISSGFEIETEISVHASQLRMPTCEIPTEYGKREEGSSSKLRTFRDAARILLTIVRLFKEIKPARFYGLIAVILSTGAILISVPLFSTYLETGQVPRFPTAILATGMMLLAAISLGGGLLLESVANGRLEQKRLFYLSMTQLGKRKT